MAMDKPTHDEVLTAERAVNERYLGEVAKGAVRGAAAARQFPTTRNQLWTGSADRPNRAPERGDPLAGRVALNHEDPDLGTGFYVSGWHREWSGVLVVGWAAPVASLFYKGSESDDPLASDVSARRSFVSRADDLVDYDDEVEAGVAGSVSPFATLGQALTVPRAPTAVHRPRRAVRQPEVPAPASRHLPAEQPTAAMITAAPTVRAAAAVETIINRPRTGELTSLLATLQPDQYRLVTWPDTSPLVVQGQPGTGKTVVAAHRAAWLVHPERSNGNEPPLTVAVVGPTEAYVEHVTPVVRQLCATGADVTVLSISQLLRDLAGITRQQHHSPNERLDCEWSHARLLARAAKRLKEAGRLRGGRQAQLRTLVDAVIRCDPAALPTAPDDETVAWLREVGTFDRAAREDRYLPFLAAAGLIVDPLGRRWDHLIVDEAQDLQRLEWRILFWHLNSHRERSISIFGDVNQRRSDWTPVSWSELAADLDLTDGDEHFRPEVLETGYRSTRRILRFANRLLPSNARKPMALREGVDPQCRRVSAGDLSREVIDAGARLADAHPQGLVAIITVQPRLTHDALRKLGWSRSSTGARPWHRDGRSLTVLHPADARGLEFDGVVVVEPADYPLNVGRHGTLYTSLTRATQELTVVHSRALPGDLRAPKR